MGGQWKKYNILGNNSVLLKKEKKIKFLKEEGFLLRYLGKSVGEWGWTRLTDKVSTIKASYYSLK